MPAARTQPSPKMGGALDGCGEGIRFIGDVDLVHGVYRVRGENMAEMSAGARPTRCEGAGDGFFAELDGGDDPCGRLVGAEAG